MVQRLANRRDGRGRPCRGFRLSLVLLILPLAALPVGCDRDVMELGTPMRANLPFVPNPELRGKILIDGSSTVYPISEAAAAAFRARYPNVNIPVGSSGTGTGFERLVKGEIEIADASRAIKSGEFQAAREAGVAFVELPIAYDGLTLVVHPSNDWMDHLTVDELKKIFTVAGSVERWSDVRPQWPDEEIQIFAPGTASGTFDYFREVVAGDEGALRSDMSVSEDDNVLVTGVAGSPYAIGFFGVAFYEENRDKLRAVPIVNPESGEAVPPTSETIESGEYAPFSRPLFIYVAASKLGRPDVKRFLEFYLESASEMAAATGYVPLPNAIQERAVQNFRERNTGTHYLTQDGEKRTGPVTEVYQESNRVTF